MKNYPILQYYTNVSQKYYLRDKNIIDSKDKILFLDKFSNLKAIEKNYKNLFQGKIETLQFFQTQHDMPVYPYLNIKMPAEQIKSIQHSEEIEIQGIKFHIFAHSTKIHAVGHFNSKIVTKRRDTWDKLNEIHPINAAKTTYVSESNNIAHVSIENNKIYFLTKGRNFYCLDILIDIENENFQFGEIKKYKNSSNTKKYYKSIYSMKNHIILLDNAMNVQKINTQSSSCSTIYYSTLMSELNIEPCGYPSKVQFDKYSGTLVYLNADSKQLFVFDCNKMSYICIINLEYSDISDMQIYKDHIFYIHKCEDGYSGVLNVINVRTKTKHIIQKALIKANKNLKIQHLPLPPKFLETDIIKQDFINFLGLSNLLFIYPQCENYVTLIFDNMTFLTLNLQNYN